MRVNRRAMGYLCSVRRVSIQRGSRLSLGSAAKEPLILISSSFRAAQANSIQQSRCHLCGSDGATCVDFLIEHGVIFKSVLDWEPLRGTFLTALLPPVLSKCCDGRRLPSSHRACARSEVQVGTRGTDACDVRGCTNVCLVVRSARGLPCQTFALIPLSARFGGTLVSRRCIGHLPARWNVQVTLRVACIR
jgi:hypothetical protein